MKKARHTSVLWARRILLALTVAVLAGIAALYVLGRAQRSTGFLAPEEEASKAEGAVLRIQGKGFDIDLTEGGRRLASVSASRLVSRREDTYFLEGVAIEAEREDGAVYRISSREATYNVKANTADLQGDVRIEGPNGMSLSTEGLQLRRHGRTVLSTSPVSFGLGPDYLGSARQLDANLRKDEFVLAGDVQVRSIAGLAPAVALDSERAAYDRKARILRTEGDVDLRHGEDRVQARRLTVHLAEDERTILFAQGFWDVHALVHQVSDDGVPHRLSAEAHELTVELDDRGRPQRMELTSGPHPMTWVQIADATGLVRTFEAGFIDGRFAQGRLSRLDGNENVRLTETLELDPQPLLRRLCGDDLLATLDAGGAVDAFSIEGNVDYAEPWSQAQTRSMVRDRRTGEVVLEGAGTWMARQGVRLESPRIVVDPETSELQATGGVRTDMEQQAGFSLGVGAEGQDEPVHVVSDEASYHPVEGFHFLRDVRAWQGRNYMLARTLGGTGERVTAEGSVKTVWHDAALSNASQPGEEEEAEQAGGERAEGSPEAGAAGEEGSGARRSPLAARERADAEDAAQPLEVFAQQLVWENASGFVEYQGAARAQQGRRTMRCANIRVHLDDENEVEMMECDGPVQIEDPVGGNKVYGDAAEYRPGSDTVLVLGDPVRLVEKTGAQFEGKAMRYDFTSGRAELDSLSERDAEAFADEGERAPVPGGGTTVLEGRSLLVARQARSEGDRFTVAGPLQLSWQALAPEPAPRPPEATAEDEEDREPEDVTEGDADEPTEVPAKPVEVEPIEVYAGELAYDKGTGVATLQGAIRFRQGPLSMRCAELRLGLTADYSVRWVECSGTAQVQQTALGDILSGSLARYETAAAEVVVTGSPARLRRSSGIETEGASIVYEVASGRLHTGEEEEGEPTAVPLTGDGGA